MTRLTPLHEVVAATVPDMTEGQRQVLTRALLAREDEMADLFRLAGIQFGLYPWIMAEVFADVGIGTPIDEAQRQMIRAQFEQGMVELRRQLGE